MTKTDNLTANAFGSTFAFFANAQTNAKKCKRATKPTHQNGQYERTNSDRKRTTKA